MRVKPVFWLLPLMLVSPAVSFAQTSVITTGAANIVQQWRSSVDASSTAQSSGREVTLTAGTPIEVEAAYTVNSTYVKPGERISFRVLIPVVIDGVTVIEEGALVTARVTQAKRGGPWGKAGRLAWTMEDVVAADNKRIPLAPETALRKEKLWSPDTKQTKSETAVGEGRVKGASHSGEVAAKSILAGAFFPPLALFGGFKRGENAILSEGRRFVVAVGKDSIVKVNVAP
jgi:hypothetical protein